MWRSAEPKDPISGGAIPLKGMCPKHVPKVGLLQHMIVHVSGKLPQQIRLEDAEWLKVWKKKMDDSWSKGEYCCAGRAQGARRARTRHTLDLFPVLCSSDCA